MCNQGPHHLPSAVVPRRRDRKGLFKILEGMSSLGMNDPSMQRILLAGKHLQAFVSLLAHRDNFHQGFKYCLRSLFSDLINRIRGEKFACFVA